MLGSARSLTTLAALVDRDKKPPNRARLADFKELLSVVLRS